MTLWPTQLDAAIPLALNGVDLELVETDAGPLWFPLSDQVMREHARNSGHWDAEIGHAIRKLFPRRAGVFLDCGANVGYFSCLVAKTFPESRVLAFEPHPVTHAVLAMNTWAHAPRVRAVCCALSDERSTVVLTTAVNNLGDTRAASAHDRQAASQVAAAAPLDELFPELRADVVKIDVQGAEMPVLRGMAGLIRRSPDIRIITEFSPSLALEQSVDPLALLDGIRSLGLRIAVLRGESIVEASNKDIMGFCRSAGPMGQVNLLLGKS